jgi:DNA-binding XRE family transcriptional regulator
MPTSKKLLNTQKDKIQKIKAFMATDQNKALAKQEYERIMKAVLTKRKKEIRKAKKLSQQEMAKMMGVKQPEIARLEKGETLPNLSTLFKFLFAVNGRFEIIY